MILGRAVREVDAGHVQADVDEAFRPKTVRLATTRRNTEDAAEGIRSFIERRVFLSFWILAFVIACGATISESVCCCG